MVNGMIERDTEMNEELQKDIFRLSSIEQDTLQEILNTAMEAAATELTSLLGKHSFIKVESIVTLAEIETSSYQPAAGIRLEFSDRNVEQDNAGEVYFIMKNIDIKSMVNILLSGEAEENKDNELEKIHFSGLVEVVNPMTQAAAKALTEYFHKPVEVILGEAEAVDGIPEKAEALRFGENITVAALKLVIDNTIHMEFLMLIPLDFTKELVESALSIQEETEPERKEAQDGQQMQSKEAEVTAQEEYETPINGQVSVKPFTYQNFDEDDSNFQANNNQGNFNLILGVPLEITVEIGRTKKLIKDILDLRPGNIVELDKQAGDPVDIIVNGQLFAKGDVVVIDDNFGVRITEIVSNNNILS
ncbi:MAG: flagellar motor switch protein FliN [Clostridiales bacterium 43-6]|nr:MAG: flagellar motor switch protein FliN [Clostridiales bacterium 43-6]